MVEQTMFSFRVPDKEGKGEKEYVNKYMTVPTYNLNQNITKVRIRSLYSTAELFFKLY